MNSKKIINKHKFKRIFMKKNSYLCLAHYSTNARVNPLESERAITAILNGDFLYVQRLSKTDFDKHGFPKVEHYRYNVTEGKPRVDFIAYYKLFEVW